MMKKLKIKLNSEGNLPPNKTLGLYNMIIIVVFFMKTTNSILKYS